MVSDPIPPRLLPAVAAILGFAFIAVALGLAVSHFGYGERVLHWRGHQPVSEGAVLFCVLLFGLAGFALAWLGLRAVSAMRARPGDTPDVWDGSHFSGCKIALVHADAVVAYLRDDKDGIPFRGFWDLPGGGRDGEETPIECALREVEEEFGLRLEEDRVLAIRRYPGAGADAADTYFCVAHITREEVDSIRFGEEGQHWRLMTAREFIARADAVPDLQKRLMQHLAALSP